MNQKKVNGVNQLTPEQEEMRKMVVELELKARYWEAQWKIKFYSLEDNKLKEEYEILAKAEIEKQQKAKEEFDQMIARLQNQQGVEIEADGEPVGLSEGEDPQLEAELENEEGRV